MITIIISSLAALKKSMKALLFPEFSFIINKKNNQ